MRWQRRPSGRAGARERRWRRSGTPKSWRGARSSTSVTFGPPEAPPFSQHNWGNTHARRTFRDGDIVNLLIESSAAGRYSSDLRRFLCIGEVPKQLQEACAVAKEARAIMAEHLKLGVTPKVALEASDRFS